MARKRENGSGWSGKVGAVVECTWMGIPYLRALPSYNYDKKSAKQLVQRAKMSVCHALVSKAIVTVRKGYAAQAVGKTAYNACMSRLMRDAVVVQQSAVKLDYRKVLLGEGPLAVATQVVLEQRGKQLHFEWSVQAAEGNEAPNDRALPVVYNASKDVVLQPQGSALRNDGNCVVDFPSNWVGDELACFLGFENQAQTLCSNIVHVGQIVINDVVAKEQTKLEADVTASEPFKTVSAQMVDKSLEMINVAQPLSSGAGLSNPYYWQKRDAHVCLATDLFGTAGFPPITPIVSTRWNAR